MAQAEATSSKPAAGVPEVPAGMENEADLFQAFSEVPNISKVVLRAKPEGDAVLTTYLSQRNLPGNNMRKFAVQSYVPAGSQRVVSSLPLELPDAQLISTSPSGRQQLIVKGGPEGMSMVLQLWKAGRLSFEILVPKGLHGPLVNDGYFSSGVTWSPDEKVVAYVAEAPPTERTPAWCGPESLKEAAGPKSWRGQGPALEDWGELNTGKRAPIVALLDVEQRAVTKVTGLPDDSSIGLPVWTRDGSGLVVTVWNHHSPNFPGLGRKLGVVFCYNRVCQLHHVTITRTEDGSLSSPASSTCLTPNLLSAASPLFSPEGSTLVFLSHQEAATTGTHNATARLYKMAWPQAAGSVAAPEVVIDVVQWPAAANQFPGLYCTSLPEDGFLDESTLLLTSQWGSQNTILSIDLSAGPSPFHTHVKPITPVGGTKPASWSLMACQHGLLVASKVAPDNPPSLVAARLPEGGLRGEEQQLEWSSLAEDAPEWPEAVATSLSDLDYEVVRVSPATGDSTLSFDSICFFPKSRNGPLPTILVPHGGPHTAVTVGWYPPYAYLAALGYAVLCPNFRGSTGYGQAALQSLPGHIGRQDVSDCMASLQAAVNSGLADPARVSVIGGSHGGFLAAHLVGQHPSVFRCGVMRNPVTNISLMVGISDIPDWCFVEVMGCEEGRKRCKAVPHPEDLAAMYQASPIRHVSNVTAPLMLMLGAKDRRVPMPDGSQYTSALRAAGGTVRVISFPEDSHGLDKPQTEFEQWLNAAWWLKQYGQ